ncbi:MAG: CoB--CoM heterodisulfide reductase iron-sulfur subunit B family protein [Desulfonatronovibrionaceae bacterium]
MNYAIFRCCVTNRLLQEYETATDGVLTAIDIPALDIRDFGCCGYPLRNVDYTASMYSAARNFALAERAGLDILTVCNCCFGSLKQAAYSLAADPGLAAGSKERLEKEGLTLSGEVRVRHLLQVLYQDIGPGELSERICRPLHGLRAVIHYGCHLLRPSDVVGFDDPFDPSICEDLVAAVGVECLDWERRLDCCGAPLAGTFDDLSLSLSRQKLRAAAGVGAHCLLCVCPFCQLQFERARREMINRGQDTPEVVGFVQLLAAALGREQNLPVLQLSGK